MCVFLPLFERGNVLSIQPVAQSVASCTFSAPPIRIPPAPVHSCCRLACPPPSSLTAPALLDLLSFLLRPTSIPHSFLSPRLPHLTLSSAPLMLTLLRAHSPIFPLFIMPSFFYSSHPASLSLYSLLPTSLHYPFPWQCPHSPSPDPIFTGTHSALLDCPSTYLRRHSSSEGLPTPTLFQASE